MLVLLLLVGSMKEKLVGLTRTDEEERHYELVKKYLLHDSSLARSKLPIMWIHMEQRVNSRWWKSFGSRNTECLNQPYQHLTIKSIVDKCGSNFNVCLIDDESFSKIVPDWNVNMSMLSDPIKIKLREVALSKILYNYGGFLVPSSFICFRDLYGIYQAGVHGNSMFVGEFVDKNVTASTREVYPNTRMMGCKAKCLEMLKYINYLGGMISKDYTDESIFLGSKDKWCLGEIEKGNMKLIKSELLGARDVDNNIVVLDHLIGSSFIDISPQAAGVYIPQDEILKRTAYQWFARMNVQQVLESNTMIGKFLLVSYST